MQLQKWINNKVDRLFKQIFNDNMDTLMRNKIEIDNKIEVTNNRINNLVLNSGGDSPNEVVDARLDMQGNAHVTLFDRLKVDYNALLSKITTNSLSIGEIEEKLREINDRLDRLYGGGEGVISIFVSEQNGDNENGDGSQSKPYRTIQRAVDSIPMIIEGIVIIEIESGRYLEDVVVNRVNVAELHIRTINHSVVDPMIGDTDVFVRSIFIRNCPGYCRLQGITFIDVANAPVEGEEQYSIYFHRVSYVAVSQCRFAENTRGKTLNTIAYNSSKGRVYGSYISNQERALWVNFLSFVELSNDTKGTNNGDVIRVGRSIVFANGLAVNGDRQVYTWAGGQLFQ